MIPRLGFIKLIHRHISPGILNVHVFHGVGTAINHGALKEKDLVLTTYETTSLDHIKGGPLRDMSWFRVVLDEGIECYASYILTESDWSCAMIAHQIRNRSTKTFQAVMALRAQRRWCLTGTPVHNKLDDLFSLTTFLRFHPVDSGSNARRYILDPLGRKDPQVLADLRSIMTTVALRRTRVADQCRSRSEQVESVSLFLAEREKYQEILFQARRILAASTRNTPSTTLLGSLLRLRQICSHGICKVASNAIKNVPKCCQCGDDLPSLQTAPKAGPLGQQHRLCYDCDLASSDSVSIPASDHLHDAQVGAKRDFSAVEIDSGTDTGSVHHNMIQAYINHYEVDSRRTNISSKLEKVLLYLKELHQIPLGSQGPVKR